ncbi:MAG: T9SS type A sorting domain-containing protein [Bacteroidales bacterium]|nr:T9SS type A sorting domain-containing protein [Bacteroidales bacterium]
MKLRLSLLSLLLALSFVPLSAQGVHYRSGFELMADTMGWVLLNGTQTNKWCIGVDTTTTGHSLFVTNDGGVSNTYSVDSTSVVYAYYEFSVMGDVCDISFDWRCEGRRMYYEYMCVFVAPATDALVPGVLPGVSGSTGVFRLSDIPVGWSYLGNGELSGQQSWQHCDTSLSLSHGTYRLIFMWYNLRSFPGARGSGAAVDNVVIDEPLCPSPASMAFSNITTDSCIVSWLSRGHANRWIVEYADSAITPGTGQGRTVYINDTVIALGHLAPNTVYHVYVTSICGLDTSPYIYGTFHTRCLARRLPIAEDFEYWSEDGYNCWYRSPSEGLVSYHNYLPHIENGYYFSHSCCNSMRFYDLDRVYIALPYTDTAVQNLMLSFWAYKHSTSNTHRLHVGVMTDPDDANSFTLVQTVDLTLDYTWEYFEVPLSSYQGNGRHVALKSANNGTYVDDITLDFIPCCSRPAALTFRGITVDSCTVSWHVCDTATRWTFEYSTQPITPGTGIGTVISTTDTVCRLAALSPNTVYYVYVRSECDCGPSLYVQDSFRTMCLPVGVPIVEDFSSWTTGSLYNSCYNCWITGTNCHDFYDNNPPYIQNYYYPLSPSGGQFLHITADANRYTYIAMPPVNVSVDSLMLSLWYNCYNGNSSFVVGVMTDPFDVATFTPVDTISLSGTRDWHYAQVSLASYTGRGRCVALKIEASRMYIDDILLDYISSCTMPLGLQVTAKTTTTVSLRWNSCPSRTQSLIEYGPSGFTYGTGTVVASAIDSIVVTGLTPRTSYDFYLRDVCGTDTSYHTLPVSAQPGVWVTRTNVADTIQLCGGILYDDGADGNYSDNQRSTVVLMPAQPGSKVYIRGSVQIYAGDTLYIYDGVGTQGTQELSVISPAQLFSQQTIGPIRANTPQGALTLLFVSDANYHHAGYAFDVLCGSPVPCTPPSPLSVSNINSTGATVSWGDTGLFQVACKAVPSSVWPVGDFVRGSSRTYRGLSGLMEYEWRVRRICDGLGFTDTSDWAYGTFTTTNPSPCDPPYDLALQYATPTTATVTWRDSGLYELSYREEISSAWINRGPVNDTMYTFTELSDTTPYQWRVRRSCPESLYEQYSPWVVGTFITRAIAVSIPEASESGGVTLYPNPAPLGVPVVVEVAGTDAPATLTLYDAAGRRIHSAEPSQPSGPSMRFILRAPSRGIYFLKLCTPTVTATRKLVIK